jgi:hypothetical protein
LQLLSACQTFHIKKFPQLRDAISLILFGNDVVGTTAALDAITDERHQRGIFNGLRLEEPANVTTAITRHRVE